MKRTAPPIGWVRSVVVAVLRFVLVMVALFMLGLFVFSRFDDPAGLAAQIDSWRPYLQVWRLLLIAALIGFWGPICNLIGQLRRLDDETVTELRRMRWTVAVILLLVELIVIQRLPLVLLQQLD